MTADPNEIYDQYLTPLITDILHLYTSIYQILRQQIKHLLQVMPDSSATGGEVSSTTLSADHLASGMGHHTIGIKRRANQSPPFAS